MPADHRLRLENFQCVQHSRSQAIEPANTRRSTLLKANRVEDLRRKTLSWCRRTRISACNAARGQNSPIKAHQINLQRSLIGIEYQPIRSRGQPSWVCGRDNGGQSWTSSHRHHEETGEFRSIQVFDFVKHAPDHDTVLKRYETSLDAMATTRRPYTR